MTAAKGKRLRWGFTTGTAAAAATRAALLSILDGRPPHAVDIRLLTGDSLKIKVHRCRKIGPDQFQCLVIKDAGDDPDITHLAEIGARVTWIPGEQRRVVCITGGEGVGKVTKPGLETPPGQPAINSGPRRMIRETVLDVLDQRNLQGRVKTEIFVPKGEELSRHTLNPRLGILGGISILGTTGVVRPLSHEAYLATIRSALSVARAAGLNRVVLTTGRRSERYAQTLWPEMPEDGFVQIGDYFAKSLGMVAEMGFQRVVLAVFFGKAVKMAQGIPHTHARSARLTLEELGRWALEVTGNPEIALQVTNANTARHAFDMIKETHPELIEKVGRKVETAAEQFGGRALTVGVVIFGFDGLIRYRSDHQDR